MLSFSLPFRSKGKQISKDKIWEEMDRKYNLTKRKHTAVNKLKQINKVARTNLECQLNTMKTSFAKRERQMVKEKRAIEEELTLIKVDRKLPPIRNQDPESDLPMSPVARSESDEFVIPVLKCDECRFGISKRRCKNFPCFLPKTYTSIGYQMTSRSYSSLPNYKEMLGYSQGLRPPTRAKQTRITPEQEHEVVNKHKTPRVSVEDRERGLRQLVKEMREKNVKNKPREWAVNYGKPLPRRTILKPILLSSNVVF
ncbi:uncharacterized protein LOC110455747 isoform X2 [Mizuhopecten yessoensis]|uniref:uncharacterized protein LOC110455747 isoform X2 n=1 Tax=Mizuhopecten yessoensis TaxID=6573 RepID=UPI000B45D163|nr:uncharacterized protein LOC110455747 isoform X2 [Mizuhopecten yessoensis]